MRSSLQELVGERNRERTSEGRVRMLLGAVYSLATLVPVFTVLTFLSFIVIPYRWFLPVAGVLTLIYAGAATWAAWRNVDPMAGVRAPSDAEALKRRMQEIVAHEIGEAAVLAVALRRETRAAFASALIAGPRALLDGWKVLRSITTEDPAVMRRTEALLARCRTPFPVSRLPQGEESLLLFDLRLVKIRSGPDGTPHAELTERGRAALSL
ncbi:MAG: hypothetical protein HYY93_03630 [Planctomycetes bacterium]|nr:hypothetical protein [Planctomycetota bacterium]